MSNLCEFGCGREAKFQSKNRKKLRRCELSVNRCPAQRKKNSLAVKAEMDSNPNKTLLISKRAKAGAKATKISLTGRTFDDIHGPEKSLEIRQKMSINIKANCNPHVWTEAEKLKRSIWAKSFGNGGYKPGSGRGKKGRYDGIWCDSSWELAFVIWCKNHNKNIDRCTEKFSYVFQGVKKNYHPDFVVDGLIYEIKGYETDQWKAKISQIEKPITVLGKNEMLPILSFVIDKYGKNFIELYG